MSATQFIFILCGLTILGCNSPEKNTESKTESISVESHAKTYAEISIKEGGHWEGREYIDGVFKNVTSLRVPDEHTDHSWYIRYEGPGWESNKVGYRIYLDWRNAIDIFGKITEDKVLPEVGQDGFDSYHEMADWGMDILKVGGSLGIGSIGRLVDDKVIHFQSLDSTYASVENSLESSAVNINYFGWGTGDDKIDLTSKLSIKPDSRITRHTIQPSESIEGICTGIVKAKDVGLIQKTSTDGKWGYIATYGAQSLIPDNLGMAIYYNMESIQGQVDGEFDYLVVFKPTTNPISYYLLAAWEQEVDGIKTEAEFLKYLDDNLTALSSNGNL